MYSTVLGNHKKSFCDRLPKIEFFRHFKNNFLAVRRVELEVRWPLWGCAGCSFFYTWIKEVKSLRECYRLDSKTKNCTIKIICLQKMSATSIPFYPANLVTFVESWIFEWPNAPFDARGAQTRYDVIWNFAPIILCRILRIFYVKMATSDQGMGRRGPAYP